MAYPFYLGLLRTGFAVGAGGKSLPQSRLHWPEGGPARPCAARAVSLASAVVAALLEYGVAAAPRAVGGHKRVDCFVLPMGAFFPHTRTDGAYIFALWQSTPRIWKMVLSGLELIRVVYTHSALRAPLLSLRGPQVPQVPLLVSVKGCSACVQMRCSVGWHSYVHEEMRTPRRGAVVVSDVRGSCRVGHGDLFCTWHPDARVSSSGRPDVPIDAVHTTSILTAE